jgi:hypothetical protein
MKQARGHKLTAYATGQALGGGEGKFIFIIDKTGKEGYDLQCISFLDQEGHI